MGIRITAGEGVRLCCPRCGSRWIVGKEKEYCHCGQCGLPFAATGGVDGKREQGAEENAKEAQEETLEEARWEYEPEYEQLSLFRQETES